MSQNESKLIYIGDPLCSWCYGFSEEISEVKKQLPENISFEIIMGGLRPYNTQTMEELGDFLKEHWEAVQNRSAQKFNYSILKDHSFVYDTEPPARAVVVVRSLKPEVEFEFFKAVQKLFYLENENTNKVDSYKALVTKFDINWNDFKTSFESEDMMEKVKSDFSSPSELGVSGFPSVVLIHNNKLQVLSNGYVKSDIILSALSKVLTKN